MGDGGAQDLDQSLALARGALRESIALQSARSPALLLLSSMIVIWPQGALAYRPFDSTDPAVAEPGEVEIELSPVSFRRGDSGETWIAPQLRLNYGFAPNWEIVIEGQGEHPRYDGAPSVMVDNAIFLKGLVREGTLQEQAGPSVAIEIGALLPGINDQSGFGGEVAGIIGNQWSWGAKSFAFGTQWHPEYKVASNPDSVKLFTAFGDAVRAHNRDRASTTFNKQRYA